MPTPRTRDAFCNRGLVEAVPVATEDSVAHMTGFTSSASARSTFKTARSLAFAACCGALMAQAQGEDMPPLPPKVAETPSAAPTALSQVGPLYIQEYRVRGNTELKAIDIEKAVYPYLGPGRSENDIEQARQGLEKAYRSLGLSNRLCGSASADRRTRRDLPERRRGPCRQAPRQRRQYFLPSKIKEQAQSMAEGSVRNFNEVQKEIIALNRWRDCIVNPELRQGVVPGTVDIDLIVEDKNPFHGSLELNNIFNANTVPLRLNGSLSYSNLWSGYTIGTSFQVAPEKQSMAPCSPPTIRCRWRTSGASWSRVRGRTATSPRSAAAPWWAKARSTASAS